MVYVLLSMLVTLETTQFERSLLNSDADLNAVSIIQITKIQNERIRLYVNEKEIEKNVRVQNKGNEKKP